MANTKHTEFYDSEKKIIKTRFCLDEKMRLDGKVEFFRPNGQYEETSTWCHGHRHGTTALYDKNGFCYSKSRYLYGKLMWRKLYQPKTNKKETI